MFVGSAYTRDVAAAVAVDCPAVELHLAIDAAIGGYAPYADALAAADPTPLEVRVEGMDMLYSSGTTGRPKGVKVPLPDAPLGTPNTLYSLNTLLFGVGESTVYLSPLRCTTPHRSASR